MRWLLIVVLVSSLGCEYLKHKPAPPPPTTNIGCEQVAPASEIPADRKKRLDEIDDLNSYIDLEIARHDKEAIDGTNETLTGARKSLRNADGLSSVERGKRFKFVMDMVNSLDEVIDTAAKHRHR